MGVNIDARRNGESRAEWWEVGLKSHCRTRGATHKSARCHGGDLPLTVALGFGEHNVDRDAHDYGTGYLESASSKGFDSLLEPC